MKTIHKFRIEPGKEATVLSLKEGHRVVRCEYLVPHKSVYLWVEQPLSIGIPTVERQFRVAFSGEPVPDSYRYLDTALDPFGPEAFHVFEVPVAEQSETVESETVESTAAMDPALITALKYRQTGTA